MVRFGITLLFAVLLCGCSRSVRMAQPEDPQGRYREHIAAAHRLLAQKEDWADRVEWEVIKKPDGWEVVAWRIEYPTRKGPKRYLPWGYATIKLDGRLVTVGYQRKG